MGLMTPFVQISILPDSRRDGLAVLLPFYAQGLLHHRWTYANSLGVPVRETFTKSWSFILESHGISSATLYLRRNQSEWHNFHLQLPAFQKACMSVHTHTHTQNLAHNFRGFTDLPSPPQGLQIKNLWSGWSLWCFWPLKCCHSKPRHFTHLQYSFRRQWEDLGVEWATFIL